MLLVDLVGQGHADDTSIIDINTIAQFWYSIKCYDDEYGRYSIQLHGNKVRYGQKQMTSMFRSAHHTVGYDNQIQ